MKFILKKKKATGAIGYVVMFTLALMMVVLTLYLTQVARLMPHQHHADDICYFETYEMTGTPVIRFQNVDEAHGLFVDCMNAAIAETTGFYYNFAFDSYICYEVEENQIKITFYSGPGGNKSVTTGRVGSVRSPKGDIVRETSVYGRVRFDIKNIIDGSFITKTKDIYCTLEINN